MMKIRIADLPIEWQDEFSFFVRDFLCEEDEPSVMTIGFETKLSDRYGIEYSETAVSHLLRQENGTLLLAEDDWSRATVYFTPSSEREFALPLAAICSRLSYFNTLLVHASLVDYNGNGVLFTGPSGIGKTTQAELWQKHLGAEIINGDKAFLRISDERVTAYGSMWKGSSPYCLNLSVPLRAVVVLRQGKENQITRLDSNKAIELFMQNVFLPVWDKKCLNNTLDTFEAMLRKVPVLLLECRADEAAAVLTHNTVFK